MISSKDSPHHGAVFIHGGPSWKTKHDHSLFCKQRAYLSTHCQINTPKTTVQPDFSQMTACFKFDCVLTIFVKNVVFGDTQIYHRTEFTPHMTYLCDRNYTLNIEIESDLNQASNHKTSILVHPLEKSK
jgi:hypothetical protein